MVRNVSNNKTKKIETFAEIFKALSNPNRLRIFLRLVSCCRPGTVSIIDANDSACVGDLGQNLGIVKSTLSHHIKELKRVGLIRTRRQGQKIECWVAPDMVDALRDFFSY
ncbi:MAG: metalloregulator ArsR/SmtB family transcription factor [Thermodesulfobacteriota bacterium]